MKSPKKFFKSRHPEQFSTSKEVVINQLDRVHLECYLSSLNSKSKELEFENFAKELCQKVICPNLIEQTGPVAGGDGKTDTQTFPVSEQNKLMWFIGINSNANSERWAFAVSTQKSWRQKCRSDVKKIAETKRGYTRVFFVSNQLAKANQRGELEDELSKQYQINVQILDINWILDEIYKNKLEKIAIDTLQIPTNFERRIELSPSDYTKQKKLEKLTEDANKINPQKISHEQVDIFLEIAELNKELEKPIYETQGLYDRAVRIAQQFGTLNQRFYAYYQYARASYYWHEDFASFKVNIKNAYDAISESTNSILWFDFITLLIIYFGHKDSISNEEKRLYDELRSHTIYQLKEIIRDKSRPSNSFLAEISLYEIELLESFDNNNKIDDIFNKIENTCRKSEYLIGFPFESIYSFIDGMEEIFQGQENYESLQDYLTEQSIKRNGELKTSKIALGRGLNQAKMGNYYNAIKIIGKTLTSLNKEESFEEMIFANNLLSDIYLEVDLYWASRANLLLSASLYSDYNYKHGKVLPMQCMTFFILAWNELYLGRIGQSLAWFKIALFFCNYNNNHIDDDDIIRFDCYLSNFILRCKLNKLKEFEYLVDNLNELGLSNSELSLLFALGYIDKVKLDLNYSDKELTDLMVRYRNLPTKLHPNKKLLHADADSIRFHAILLGCEVIVSLPNKTPFIELSESIISSLECFLSTALLDEIFAMLPILYIDIIPSSENYPIINHENGIDIRGTYFKVFCSNFSYRDINIENIKILDNWFIQFLIEFICTVFTSRNLEKTIKNMVIGDNVFSRSMTFGASLGGIYNIFGEQAHENLSRTLTQGTHYPLLRDIPWDIDIPNEILETKDVEEEASLKNHRGIDLTKITHGNISMSSIIRADLWDVAEWSGISFALYPNLPPCMALLFKNRTYGSAIFKDLLQKLGSTDKDNKLRISLLLGVSSKHPSYYRVVITGNPHDTGANKLFLEVARVNEMNPDNGTNLDRFLALYKKYRSFLLLPAFINKDNFTPDHEIALSIEKELVIKRAWEIGVNDMERVAIYPDDNIAIPDNISNPPCLDIINSYKNIMDG